MRAYIIHGIIAVIALTSTLVLNSIWVAISSIITLTAVGLFLIRRVEVKMRKSEEEIARLRATLERFSTSIISNISHEFRTPLTSIIGYAQCIAQGLDGEVTEEQRRDVERIIVNAQDLLKMVDDALELSKIEAGKLDLKFESVDFRPILKEALETIEPMVKEKGLKVEENIPESLPKVLGDRLKIKRILLNLLSNAVKFTSQGEIMIQVEANGPFLEVSVSDTGPGIPPDLQKRLFDRKGRPEDTGFGLIITKELVELHGGTIRVKSQPGEGSTFTFTLPIITERLREHVLRNLEERLDDRQREIILKIYDWLKEESWHGSSEEKGSGDR
jgi:signal transduction histidine kinase